MALNNLKDEAYKIRMTPEEKSAMKARLFGLPTVTSHKSPYVVSIFQLWQLRVLAPLAIVFLIGSGTTYAAEGALPGDTLYPVKIYVNESVALSLARSPKAKAEAYVSLAERRVAEAQALAAEGRLDATTSETLAVDLETRIVEAEIEADKAEETETGKGREVRTKLAATLDTGARVLARIGEDKDDATKESAETLSARLLARADTGAAARARTLSKAAPAADTSAQTMSMMVGAESSTTNENPAAQKVAASLEHEAVEALRAARAVFSKGKDMFGTSTAAQLEKEFSSVETLIGLGSASFGTNAFEQAEHNFTDALSLAIKLQKILEAHDKFDDGHILELLDTHSRYEGGPQVYGTTTEDILELELPVDIGTRGKLPPKVLN